MQLETHSARACLRYGVAPRVVAHCLAPSLQYVLTQQSLLPQLTDQSLRAEVDQLRRQVQELKEAEHRRKMAERQWRQRGEQVDSSLVCALTMRLCVCCALLFVECLARPCQVNLR